MGPRDLQHRGEPEQMPPWPPAASVTQLPLSLGTWPSSIPTVASGGDTDHRAPSPWANIATGVST